MIPEDIRKIKISDFAFAFEDDLIAQNPLPVRDESKLLHFKNGEINHFLFKKFPELLSPNSQIILNNAKVIPARLNFYRSSGAKIEIFLLEPESSLNTPEQALSNTNSSTWKCMIGNLKKWKNNEILISKINEIKLEAKLFSEQNQSVQFTWNQDLSFAEILEMAGKIPLPPYIKRKSNEEDKINYQTVFAKNYGAVAAPTAGLHFTKDIIDNLEKRNVDMQEVTLYVSAGTFAPVKVKNIVEHTMHPEMFSVLKSTIKNLINDKCKIAIGTTSLRTLESLYWIGVKLMRNEDEPFYIEKLYPYLSVNLPITWNESMNEILKFLEITSLDTLNAKTEIMIMPGYKFTSVKGLLTNFHYPNTTLVMLVAAFIGDDWQKIYSEAIANNYRFLSYGDCCFLEL